jgi:transcriptional regulator with XRE-family HTH domain
MTKSLTDKLAALPAGRRAKIEARAVELIAEEMALRDLRKAMGRTQTAVAKEWGVTQDAVSRVERRADMLLSTLRDYVRAAGGDLELLALLPGRSPVRLAGLGDVTDHVSMGPKKAAAAKKAKRPGRMKMKAARPKAMKGRAAPMKEPR